ncbi:MAG: DoxX family protein [Planctomycetota bacterium]|jgi:putative oxidoreductase|nr:DoxX family protein [Planctomycetota bacterium]
MESLGLLLLRITAGLGLASHGYAKIFGTGMEGFTGFLEQLGFPFPLAMAWMAKLIELVGGILIAVGFCTRASAFLAAAVMAMAILTAHWGDPFAKWEIAAPYLAAMLTLMLAGPGRFSIDTRRSQRSQPFKL